LRQTDVHEVLLGWPTRRIRREPWLPRRRFRLTYLPESSL
jgi:hypothetical protein